MNSEPLHTRLETPLGPMLLVSDGEAITGFYYADEPHLPAASKNWVHRPDAAIFVRTEQQLREFAAGTRREFDLPVRLSGTPFQKTIWEIIASIPFGETISYSELAGRAGRPKAVRAAGAATGQNPVSWIVPCHRVVGKNGTLTGYAGGLNRKTTLLRFEAARKRGQPAALAMEENPGELPGLNDRPKSSAALPPAW